jgi:hypothetical protein
MQTCLLDASAAAALPLRRAGGRAPRVAPATVARAGVARAAGTQARSRCPAAALTGRGRTLAGQVAPCARGRHAPRRRRGAHVARHSRAPVAAPAALARARRAARRKGLDPCCQPLLSSQRVARALTHSARRPHARLTPAAAASSRRSRCSASWACAPPRRCRGAWPAPRHTASYPLRRRALRWRRRSGPHERESALRLRLRRRPLARLAAHRRASPLSAAAPRRAARACAPPAPVRLVALARCLSP